MAEKTGLRIIFKAIGDPEFLKSNITGKNHEKKKQDLIKNITEILSANQFISSIYYLIKLF